MALTITKTDYKFADLNDDGKEKAIKWFRDAIAHDDWYDSVYEYAATIGEILGIDLKTRPVKLMNGSTRQDPNIFFSGFSSQGDGACFEGSYEYRKKSLHDIKAYAPKDKALHEIAANLQAVQKRNFYGLYANVEHSGQHYHSRCTRFGIRRDDAEMTADAEDDLTEYLRDFMNWIYRALENEHDYQNSDDVIIETIEANEYEFDREGNIA